MDNKKVASLLNKGMKFDSLKMLNETQIDTLYSALIQEQSLASTGPEIEKLRAGLGFLQKDISDTIDMVVGEEENEDGLEDLARQDYTGQEGPHDEKNMAPDGMDDDSDNNLSEMGEEFKSKSQQGYFFAKCEEEGPKSKWCKMADEFAADTDFSKLPEKVKAEEIRQIEESIVSLVKKYVPKTMSKKDLMDLLKESPGTKEAPVKIPTRTKPERKTPYKPKHKPAPKAGETETAPSRVKPGTIEKPERKTPYKPKYKPVPKAAKKELPSFLKFNTLNIQFTDEK
jgi:hypothetical protein